MNTIKIANTFSRYRLHFQLAIFHFCVNYKYSTLIDVKYTSMRYNCGYSKTWAWSGPWNLSSIHILFGGHMYDQRTTES